MGTSDPSRRISDKHVRAIVELLLSDGWEFVRMSGSNHPILNWPAGQGSGPERDGRTNTGRLVLTSTPSDRRSLRNCLSDARAVSGVNHARLLRGAARPKHLPPL